MMVLGIFAIYKTRKVVRYMWGLWVILGLLAAGAIVGLIGGLLGRDKQKQLEQELATGRAAPIVQRPAVVLAKEVARQMTGTYQVPGHRIAYAVRFGLDSKEELLLEVPEEAYDGLLVGAKGTLVTRDDHFLDFAGTEAAAGAIEKH